MEFLYLVLLVLVMVLATSPAWLFFFFRRFYPPWKLAKNAGIPVTYKELVVMSIRHIPYVKIVKSRIAYFESGFDVSLDDLCFHYLAGGNPAMVLAGLQKAKANNINLSFEQACEFDLKEKGLN